MADIITKIIPIKLWKQRQKRAVVKCIISRQPLTTKLIETLVEMDFE